MQGLSSLLMSFLFFNTIPYVENEVIVWFDSSLRPYLEKFSPQYDGGALTIKTLRLGIPEFDDLNESLGAKEIQRLLYGKITEDAKNYNLDLLYIVRFDEPIDVLSYVKKYKNLTIVTDAFPNLKYKVTDEPNDPYYSEQWYLPKIKAPEGWDISHGDTSIAVGPIDTGVDWHHPDLFPNLWVNPGEDINGNGIFDYPDDINGVDDDDNGFIDDIIGYDFYGNDWNPEPSSPDKDHGTHVFGIAVAATNNGIGIAGVGWDVKGMALKCGSDPFIYLNAAINGIYYATEMGAVATNHSYGGSYNSLENTAIQYAHSHNVTVVASAGNENSSLPHYPAAYDNVVAVAATSQSDIKAWFSNYGTYVDVCAPGVDIFSTVPDSGYAPYSGTSMSSPIVCGFVGLVRSLHPSWTSSQVDSALMWGCDNIDSLNPGFEGMLGWGRINIWRTLALTLYPYIEIVDYWFDGDGRPEPGEDVKLYLRLANREHWQDASNITITLSTDDPYITLLDSVATLSSLSEGDTVDLSDYFEFHVSGELRFTYLYFNIASQPTNVWECETLRILIGYPEIVLVNDGREGASVIDWYTKALDSLSLVYEEWNVDEGLPEGFLAHERNAVIWFTGNDSTEVLSPEEIDSLESYLNSGGNLFITSQYLAEDPDAQSFISDYLKTDIVELDVSYITMKGYSGDPVGDNLFLKLYGPPSGGAGNNRSPDKITALPGADTVLYYTTTSGSGNYGPGAVKYNSGNYKTVYFAFPFEAIDDNAPGRNKKSEVLERILAWFGIVEVRENASKPEFVLDLKPELKPTVTRDIAILEFQLPISTKINLNIYDIAGRRIGYTLKGIYNKGHHSITLNFSSLPQGIYFLKFGGVKEFNTLKIVKIGK